jgi:hypothetical protein
LHAKDKQTSVLVFWCLQAMADWYAQPFPVVPEIGLEEIVYDIRALRQQNVGMWMQQSTTRSVSPDDRCSKHAVFQTGVAGH